MIGIFGVAQALGQPGAQRRVSSPASARCGLDDGLLARFQRAIEIGRDGHVVRNETAPCERPVPVPALRLTSTILAPPSAATCLICAKLCVADESMPVTRRKSKIRNRQSGCRASRRLDVLVKPVGRAEEQIALQRHALNLVAVFGQQRQFARPAIERRADIPSRRS